VSIVERREPLMADRDDMWRELERRGVVYARIIFSVQQSQARVEAIILYDGYAPPWHHELGEVEPDSDLGVALWVAGGGRDIEQGDVVSGDGEMGFRVAERAANMAWHDLLPPVRRGQASTVLIELPGGEGVVRGDDGEIMLMHDVTLDRGQPLQPWDRYQPLRVGLGGERMLFGGLLPPGAVSVEAVEATGVRKAAVVGGGAYAVIFSDGEHGEPALGYRDAAGEFVHRPMPAEYPHRLVADAQEPCPVCWAVQYEEYFPTEDWRGGSGTKGSDSFVPSPLIVCRVCGHQEQGGGIMRLGQCDRVDEDAAAREARMARIRAEEAVQRWYSDTMTLRAVTFPIYAVEGWPARINGQGSRGDELTHVRIAHAQTLPEARFVERPRIEVTTSIDTYQPDELALARDTFASGIEADANLQPADGLSDPALTLWFRAARRRRVASAHDAEVSDIEIEIDGAREPFLMVGTPNAHWVAVRRHHDVTITIAAREIDPASLIIDPIANPGARLLGPKPDEP
jgi:hypothetical protein